MAGPGRFEPICAHEEHPDLDSRMRLAARILIARELRAIPNGASDLDNAVRDARIAADIEWEEAERLDTYLSMVAVAARRRARNLSPASKKALADFKAKIDEICCNDCALRGAKIACDRSFADDRNLAGGASCLEVVFDIFRKMVSLAEGPYSRHLADTSSSLKIVLKTRIAGGARIEGETEFAQDDTTDHRVAVVTIDLPHEIFDESHLGGLPYILLHEIFVHAPEGSRGSGDRRPSTSQCALREGFMDRAAYRLLKDWLDKPSALPVPFDQLYAHVDFHSDRIHSSRYETPLAAAAYEPGAAIERIVRSRRMEGRRAFDHLYRGYGDEKAFELATRLNLLELNDLQKSNLLILLKRGGEAMTGVPAALDSSKWLDLLGQMKTALEDAGDHDVLALVDSAIDKNDF